MPSTEPDGRPGALIWLAALASLVMPIAGFVAALYGAYGAFNRHLAGWLWLAAGLALLIADLIIDQRWSRWMPSKEPALNRRGDQLIGQVLTVVEPIEGGGRGSVRAADSVWPAEGAEAARGAKVRVTGCNGTVLTIESP
jgi:membrane protein implicated in regulation of membrane protease activity